MADEGTVDAAWIENLAGTFIAVSGDNTLRNEGGEPAWEECLIGCSSGADPLYEEFKNHVGPFHFTPAELYNLTFPEAPASPGELTVVSWVLPQRQATKADNRGQDYYPAERWLKARVFGEEFNDLLRKHLVEQLAAAGFPAVAPLLSPHWKTQESPVYGRASRWSERHAAYAAGLGTFGLCDGLITAKGKAHRLGSVIVRLRVAPSPRPYRDHHAYCLFFRQGGCRACARRCPVGAITEKGHDKAKCYDHLFKTCARYSREMFGLDGYGCGLCQAGVPCESGIPGLGEGET